jgi:membrane-bound lytic murein transglycosylase MltF
MLSVALGVLACSSGEEVTGNGIDPAPEVRETALEQEAPLPLPPTAPTPSAHLDRWVGDLDGMIERREIRALVTYSQTFYFLDGPHQKGISYEALQHFEKWLNEELGRGTLKVRVVIIPVGRDQLIPALVDGRGDLAAANLTITGSRSELVSFSDPFLSGVSELVVTPRGAEPLGRVEDLSGREVVVRRSSSYYESLQRLNRRFAAEGLPRVELTLAGEHLEDEELLEMVNAGLIPAVVVDSHKARFWEQIFDGIELHPEAAVATDREIAWAVRADSPKLRERVGEFLRENRKGTLMGNILFKRYLRSTRWVEKSLSQESLGRFGDTVALFRKYAEVYEFDWLMLVALAYQESRLDQDLRSRAGAVGVMQILPSTAADPKVDIRDIHLLERNIEAGTKYLRFLRSRYFADPKLDGANRTYFTFAAYNAGPRRIAQLRDEAARDGLDPNVWFDNVEVVAARRIGRETVQYVSNISKYHMAYSRIAAERAGRKPPLAP